LDADLDLHPSHLINMFEILKANNADAVIGSKMHKDSVIHVPFYRKVFSFTYYLLIKILSGFQSGHTNRNKTFQDRGIKKCISHVVIKRYAFDLELLLVLKRKVTGLLNPL